MLRMELKKAFSSTGFYGALAVGLLVSVINAIQAVNGYLYQYKVYFASENLYQSIDYSIGSLYTMWLGGNGNFTANLYFFILFIICMFPFSWSLLAEKQSGYLNHIVVREQRNRYYLDKYAATFLSGGIVSVFPLIVNFIICACFIPAYKPDQFGELYFGVPQNYLWSEYFYSNPLLYVALYMCLTFCFTGFWATIGISLSFFRKKKLEILITPFLVLIFIQVLKKSIFLFQGRQLRHSI